MTQSSGNGRSWHPGGGKRSGKDWYPGGGHFDSGGHSPLVTRSRSSYGSQPSHGSQPSRLAGMVVRQQAKPAGQASLKAPRAANVSIQDETPESARYQPWLQAGTPKPGEQWSDKLGRVVFAPIIKHYGRNRLNRPELAENKMSPKESIFHTWEIAGEGQGADNSKYISPDGHYEAVRNPDKTPVLDPANQGTYNYVNPNAFFGVPHGAVDVLPYLLFGNSPQDPTTIGQRVMRRFDYPLFDDR